MKEAVGDRDKSLKYPLLALVAVVLHVSLGTPSDLEHFLVRNIGVLSSRAAYLLGLAIQVATMFAAIMWMGKASGVRSRGRTADADRKRPGE